jgi:hypothetical protein
VIGGDAPLETFAARARCGQSLSELQVATMVTIFEIFPVLALAFLIVCIPLLDEPPSAGLSQRV